MPLSAFAIAVLIPVLGIVVLVLAVTLAWWKGSYQERFAATLMAIVWFFSVAIWEAAHLFPLASFTNLQSYVGLVGAAIVAAGFLLLAIRFASWWIGFAMLAESIEFGMIAHFLASPKDYVTKYARNDYVLHQNLISFAVLFILIGGTLASWRSEVLRKRRAVELAANPPPEPFAWVGTAALMKAHEKPLAKPPAQP